MHNLDHLLWEEFRLDEGQKRFSELTGITPADGGAHPNGGTHNSLLSLGGGAYLEIVAPDPARAEAFGFSKEAPPGFTPRLFAFSVKSGDVTRVRHMAERAGLSSSLQDIFRERSDGEVLQWQTVMVGGREFGNMVPFFTRFLSHGGALHPSETAPKGCGLLEFSVGHHQKEELSHLYKALGVTVPVFWSEQPQLRAVLATPRGNVVLNSEGIHQS